MKLILGVTGTREGMNKIQKENLEKVIETLLFEQEYEERILHQGQCQGVDVQVAKILKSKYGFKIISHPPVKKDLIGVCENDEVRLPKGYLARDRDIVNECNILLVVPKQNTHQKTGGTWYTHDYARKQNKDLFLILSDGSIKESI